MSGRRRTASAGFTLLEVLAGLIVFGFIMAGLAQGFDFGVHAMGLQQRATRHEDDSESVDRALRGLLHRTARSGTALVSDLFAGSRHTLAFTTMLPQAGEQTAQLVDVGLGVDSRHRLTLRWKPRFVQPLGPSPPPRIIVLLDGVDHIDFGYWRDEDKPAGWATAWSGDDPPELVRIGLAFTDPARRWPDIVASTRGG